MGDDGQLDRTSRIGQILNLIETRYADNPAMVSLAETVKTERAFALGTLAGFDHILSGHRRFAEGRTGYSGLYSLNDGILSPILREASAHIRLEAVVTAAVCALQALGEDISY